MIERQSRQRSLAWRGRLMSVLAFRVPLWNPDPLLRRMNLLSRLLFSPAGLIAWLVERNAGKT